MTRAQSRRIGSVRQAALGFTLLEAVVSLAIVLLAVAALLPTLSTARAKVISTSCQANQLALGMGWSSYVADYAELPGIHYQEGTYWSKPWGQPVYYGGVQAWMANGEDFAGGYLGASGAPSGYSGIGFVYPYIGGDGKTFYCPGTAASFEGTPGKLPWHNYWTGVNSNTGQPLPYWGFGKQGKGTIITYFYRSGMYEKNKGLPDSDPAWGGWQSAGENWTWTQLSRPSDPWVSDKPMLTCFWFGYRETSSPTWAETGPHTASINHEGVETNLLYTDGSVRTWQFDGEILSIGADGALSPRRQGMSPVWGWFDGYQYNIDQFRTGSLDDGYIVGYPEGDFRHQMPFWWVVAERALR